MHEEIIYWMLQVKRLFPNSFTSGDVLDVGSQDINGTNKYFFDPACHYEGLDIVAGKNVNIVSTLHEYAARMSPAIYDVVVSTDCLEHDQYWRKTLAGMIRLLKPGGLMVWTCAGEGRDEHGTALLNPDASPGTLGYYMNVTPEMVEQQAYSSCKIFKSWSFDCCTNAMGPGLDTRFWGVKKI